MKIRLWMAAIPFLLAWPALADGPVGFDVSAADLTAAGAANVVAVEPAAGRFTPPVRYFRTSEKLSEADAKKDCSDCADLVAVYVVGVPGVPNWAETPGQQFLKVGARLQLRTYIKAKKRIVTVTAPNEALLRKISSHLVAKFSK